MTATATAARQVPVVEDSRVSQIWKMTHAQNEIFDRARARHGDVFRMSLARGNWTFFAHPDQVKEIFTGSPDVLHAGRANEILATALGDHSLLLLDEDEHMRQRKLLLPSFHGQKLARQTEQMERITEREVSRLPRGETFVIRDLGQDIALGVILEVVLGTAASGTQHDRLGAVVRKLLDWVSNGARFVASSVIGPRSRPIRRMYRPALAPLDEALYELIADRRQATDLEDRDDILSMLLLARDEDDRPMTDNEIRDELVTLIVAGHETTATALSWAFERLTRLDGGAERLHEESLTDQTEYAGYVIHEALRLRPVIDFVVRRVNEPVEIGGYEFEEGDVVAPCIYLVHRREDIYPDPLVFNPDRWAGQKPGTYTWFPFGGGVRRCIGMQFAMAEMEIVMRAIAREGILLPVDQAEAPVARFITTSPKHGGRVRFAF